MMLGLVVGGLVLINGGGVVDDVVGTYGVAGVMIVVGFGSCEGDQWVYWG